MFILSYQGGLIEQGLLQHQGDLTVVEGRFSSSRRRVFLFENMIIVAKKNKVAKGSTETFTYKESYKVWLSVSDDEVFKSLCRQMSLVSEKTSMATH